MQITENTVQGTLFAPPFDTVVAEVEQVSEQVGVFESPPIRDVGTTCIGPLPETNTRRSGLEHAGDTLESIVGEFRMSKRQFRQVESIEMVRERRDAGQQKLGFAARPFVLCGLPIRKPPASTLLYERRNGLFTLQITGHPHFGLPYGQDRLAVLFLATLAVRQQSQIIRFHSATEMLDTFGMARGGKEYRRLVAAFERIFGATIFFGTESVRHPARMVQRSRFHFLREAHIWYQRDQKTDSVREEFQNVVVLSDEFFAEVMAHPIPADIEVVKVFGAAPGLLDLFLWLTYRCHVAKMEERIPLFGEFGLTAQLGSVEYSRPRRFRAMLEQWLQQIRVVWPECPAHIGNGGTHLRVASAQAVRRRVG